jgi:hypothetical protein
MAVKHALVVAVLAVTGAMTFRYWKEQASGKSRACILRPFLWLTLLLGLAIAYVMIIVLLIHEGVDHVL